MDHQHNHQAKQNLQLVDHSTHDHADHCEGGHSAEYHETHCAVGHDHADHSAHNHEDHSAHNHADHSAHNHADHSAHNHEDHSAHNHEDHSAHNHADHSAHNHEDHGAHNHADHSAHNHEDHSAHNHEDHSAHNHEDHGAHNHEDHGGHHGHGMHAGHEAMFRTRFWVSLVLTIPVLLYTHMIQEWFGFMMPMFTGSEFIPAIFSIIIFAYGGVPFLEMSVPEIKDRKPGMMLLISLAVTVSFLYSLFALVTNTGMSFFWEMATLIDVMLLGHWMEMRSVRQASGALDELAKLLPDQAERIFADGTTEIVAASELQHGDILLVRPGASVPADGEIVQGLSELNEAMITGESKPVEKTIGDAVIAGTINGDGSLRIRVQATGTETALAGIMRLVEEAQNSKSNTQILADQAAGWLFYLAITVAAITAIAWTIAVGWQLEVLERIVTVLVIACPHALGLAIPLVVAISTTLGAKNGILVRDRLALEEARKIQVVVFDKTGTLTEGQFGVMASQIAPKWDAETVYSLAWAIENDSEHPIAKGIREDAQKQATKPATITAFEAIKGRGIRATWQEKTVYLGGPRLLEWLKLDLTGDWATFRDRANASAQTVVYLVVEQEVVGAFALADRVRKESRQAVDQLHAMGIQVAMLTGDSKAVAESVAKTLGIDRVFAEVLPEHKDQKIAELQRQGLKVAMVGDGVNDAPALTRADIGIAIGSGTDVAIQSAGIILVQSNPLDVVKIITLSRATYRKMIQNLLWATGYNLFSLPLAAGILAPWGFILSPAVGAAFMSLSTIVVAINAQFLRRLDLKA